MIQATLDNREAQVAVWPYFKHRDGSEPRDATAADVPHTLPLYSELDTGYGGFVQLHPNRIKNGRYVPAAYLVPESQTHRFERTAPTNIDGVRFAFAKWHK